MKVKVMVFASEDDFLDWASHDAGARLVRPIVDYVMDHDDFSQRRRLGESCRDAFEAGQVVVTMRC